MPLQMPSRRHPALVLGLVVSAAIALSAAQASPPAAPRPAPAPGQAPAPALPDVTRIGPQVGETIPAFSLVDQQGATRTLASLRGSEGLMLVFFRSADW